MFSSFSTTLSLSKPNEACAHAPTYKSFAAAVCKEALITYIADKLAQRVLSSTATPTEVAEFKKTCTQAMKGFAAIWEGTLTRRFFNTLTEFLLNYQWPNASIQQRMAAHIITDIISEVLNNMSCPAKAIVSTMVGATGAVIGAGTVDIFLTDETADALEEKAFLETNKPAHNSV